MEMVKIVKQQVPEQRGERVALSHANFVNGKSRSSTCSLSDAKIFKFDRDRSAKQLHEFRLSRCLSDDFQDGWLWNPVKNDEISERIT